MNVVIFGATGMVGQGVLRECLLDPWVERVITVVRSSTGASDPKLREIVVQDFSQFSSIERQLSGLDACFYCLGVGSVGMTEADYERITYGITIAAAKMLSVRNPQMTFVFVSAAGADSSEKGRFMWARIKGKTENAVLRLPFKAVYVFRPGAIQPLHGIRSRTKLYRVLYAVTKPLLPILRWAFPGQILTTEQIGRAMLNVARSGAAKRILERQDINAVARML
jgi:uncharacterized protein YbjT (DUF2867 family)